MRKIFFSFIIYFLSFPSPISAKSISNDVILQSISDALNDDRIKNEDDIRIPINSKSVKPNPDLNLKLIIPKVNDKKLEAFEMLQKGYYEIALGMYKKLNKSYPEDNEIKFSLAYLYHKLNLFQEAKNLYYQVIKSNYPFKEKAINNILDIVSDQQDGDTLFILKKLSAENSNNPHIISRLAFYYEKQNKLNEAILLMKKAHYLKPKELSYKLNLAILYDKNREYQNASSIYQQIINDYNLNKINSKEVPIFHIKNRLEFIRKL